MMPYGDKRQAVTMRRFAVATFTYATLLMGMACGWHNWPLCITYGITYGMWLKGFRLHEDRLYISDAELYRLLRHG